MQFSTLLLQNVITEVDYVSEDTSLRIRLIYVSGKALHLYPRGKTYPKHTQCLMIVNELIAGFKEIVKHEKDEDNRSFAITYLSKAILKDEFPKSIRKAIWKLIFEKIEKLEKINQAKTIGIL